jgi:hypothetical protein
VQWTMLLLALWGLSFAGEMFYGQPAYLIAMLVLGAGVFCLLVGSLAPTLRHRATGGLSGVIWGGLGVMVLSAIIVFILWFVLMVQDAGAGKPPDFKMDSSIFSLLGAFHLQGAGPLAFFAWAIIILGAACVTLGVAGYPMAMVRRSRHSAVDGPPTASTAPPVP